MRLSFGCDACAVTLKRELMAYAESLGHTCKDCGVYDGEPNDYPLFAVRASELVQKGDCAFGIVLCGTGVGMSLAANKLPGIRCALVSDCYTARMTRAHNDANMLSLGARVIGSELAKAIFTEFISTPFEGGRHQRRVDMISKIESGGSIEPAEAPGEEPFVKK